MTGGGTAPWNTTLREALLLLLKPRSNWFQAERGNDHSSSKRDDRQTPSSALGREMLIGPQERLSDISRDSFALNRRLPLQIDMGQLTLPRVCFGAEGST